MSKHAAQEILIIRRGGGDDHGAHHGGAWKIAYADFVTAMMAFFLVMWLINSANEVTKARVASYFNPIKMTDASPARRGLKEEIDAQSPNNHKGEQREGGGAAKKLAEGNFVAELAVSDDKLLMNPYALLDELVKHSNKTSKSGAAPDDSSVQGDPFNPRSFEHLTELQVTTTGEDPPGKSPDAGKANAEPVSKVVNGEATRAQTGKPERDVPGTQQDGTGSAVKSAAGGTTETSAPQEKGFDAPMPKAGETKGATSGDLELAQKFREQIENEIAKFKGVIDLNAHVKVTDEGLLISLEDGHGRSMFSIGSAQPNPALIQIIGKIGALFAKTEGLVVVRGHTDGRQFRNRKYDNWQLSTDRAHMANYMLIRGGLAEARVKRIEGYGSSSPMTPGDVMSDANRRVEFLLAK